MDALNNKQHNSILGRTQDYFYSQLRRAIESAPEKIFGRAEQVSAWLLANSAKMQIKKEELYWSGLEDWLVIQDRVGREDVLGFLDAHGVQVDEVLLGGSAKDAPSSFEELPRRIQDLVMLYDNGDIDLEIFHFGVREAGYDANMDMDGELENIVRVGAKVEPTIYGAHVLPGGFGYRELLLTLPNLHPTVGAINEQAMAEYGKSFDELNEAQQLSITDDSGSKEVFKSFHFDQPNILAHVRMNERVDADGKNVLFIEELQSDWGQLGKKNGFKTVENSQRRAELEKEQESVLSAMGEYNNVLDKFRVDKSEARSSIENLPMDDPVVAKMVVERTGLILRSNKIRGLLSDMNYQERNTVPAAPFVQDTKAWAALAIKHVISYAIDNGFEKVAFTTGAQQSERYDLSKQFNSIEAVRKDNGQYYLITHVKNKDSFYHDNVDEDSLAEFVGKDLATKIAAQSAGDHEYSGIDLTVGSAGMKGFYDVILPQVVNDVLKRVGGGKVEKVTFGSSQRSYDEITELLGNGALYPIGSDERSALILERETAPDYGHDLLRSEQSGFAITPQMKSTIQDKGFPVFSLQHASAKEGLSLSVIQAEIARLAKQWPAMPEVTIVESVDELSFAIDPRARGAFYDQHVYIVAGKIHDLSELQLVMAHECVLHYGVESMLGSYGFSKVHQGILDLIKAKDPVVTRLAREVESLYGHLPLVERTREIIARAGESCLDGSGNVRLEYGFMKTVYAGVASWLRDQGFKIPFSNTELQGIIHNAGKWIERDQEKVRGRVGGRVAHSFGGVRAENAPIEKMAQAREMLSSGVEDREIWKETGWTFGFADGKPRFEIDDSGLQLNRERFYEENKFLDSSVAKEFGAQVKLQDLSEVEKKTMVEKHGQGYAGYGKASVVVPHQDLYANYPNLTETYIKATVQPAIPCSGSLSVRGIEMNASNFDVVRDGIAHEMQHAIQKHEGFAQGGSPDSFKELDVTDKELSRLNVQLHKLFEQNTEFYSACTKATRLQIAVSDKFGGSGKENVDDPLVQEWWAAISVRDEFPESEAYFDLKSQQHLVARDRLLIDPITQYRSLAGEVEARLTESRLMMSADERREAYPIDGMDVKVVDQRVVMPSAWSRAVVSDGMYAGKVLEVSNGVVVQKTGRHGETAMHAASRLDVNVKIGDLVDIRYEGGRGVVGVRGVGVER